MIVALTGLKSSGKSTVADYLVSEHGFELVSFARLLKQSVAALFGITVEEIEEWKNDDSCTITLTRPNGMKTSMTMRVFLQRYGTEAHREVFGQDFWVEQALLYWNVTKDLVCADCRFENEALAVMDLGGKVYRIDREAVVSDDTHASEAGLPAAYLSGVLDNNGTILQLDDQVESVILGA